MSEVITKEKVIEHLEMVIDPELAMDIWTLGLIYTIDIPSNDTLSLTMTYTTPLCPAGPAIQKEIRDEMMALGFKHVEIEVTFDPPWTMPPQLRTMLGL